MSVFVYKLGGSLLDLSDLAARVLDVLALRRDSRPLLVVGGGAAANLVRRWDELHSLGEERAHWLALKAMRLNESLVESLLPAAKIIRSRDEAEQAWRAKRVPIVCARDFLQSEETLLERAYQPVDSPAALPHTWKVTSDSIAAWVALRWPATGLVFLKSRPLSSPAEAAHADDETLVDDYFPTLAPLLTRIEWINLREAKPVVEPWISLPDPARRSGAPV